MLTGPLAFYTVLGRVRDASVTALRNLNDQPARVAVVPGAIAWDECDQCGLLALAVTRLYLADGFPIETPQPVTVFATQGALLCADLVVQIVRCAPQPVNNANAPTVEALDASAQEVIADATTVMCSTVDTLNALMISGDIADFLVRQQLMMGPEGACVGSELTFSVGVVR